MSGTPYMLTVGEARAIERRISRLERRLNMAAVSPAEHPGVPERDRLFMAMVIASEPLNDDPTTQWRYYVQRARLGGAGYGHWQPLAGAGVDTLAAYNLAEENNSQAGQQGNGVNIDNLDGFALQPIPDGTPVLVAKAAIFSGGGVQFVIVGAGVPNGVDGVCP